MAAKKRRGKKTSKRRGKKKTPSVINLNQRVTRIEKKLKIKRKRKRSAEQKRTAAIMHGIGI